MYKALKPDYLMILGSVDVIPHQDMVTPAHYPSLTEIPIGWLPAICPMLCHALQYGDLRFHRPHPGCGPPAGPDQRKGPRLSCRPADHGGQLQGPTGREILQLPWDQRRRLEGLDFAKSSGRIRVVARPAGLSARRPGRQRPAGLLGRRSHYINCHGATADYQFYGQPDHQDEYPIAFKAGRLPGQITEGTVVATECYDLAELYDPALTGGRIGICSAYLAEKAYGYFGSSTIADGPDDHNDNADLICQYYFKHMLSGSSSGRAALHVRLDLIAARSPRTRTTPRPSASTSSSVIPRSIPWCLPP